MFARRDMTEEELIDDVECLGGLVRTTTPPVPVKNSRIYEFGFPEQETKLRAGKYCVRCDTSEPFGSIAALDEARRIVSIKARPEPAGSGCVGDRSHGAHRHGRPAQSRRSRLPMPSSPATVVLQPPAPSCAGTRRRSGGDAQVRR